MKNGKDNVWLITGANKGLGAAIAKEALDRGYKVVATGRNPKSVGDSLGNHPNLLITKLDITNDEQVKSAVEAAMKQFGRIDLLVNNAGYGLLGFFEEMSEKLIRQQIETNVFGTMKVTRAVLPFMRKQRSGLIIVVSSASGVRAVVGNSIYAASKFALEGWTEGMNIDLEPFGIRCMLIEPGGFRTDFANIKTSMMFSDLEVDDYKQQREKTHNLFMSMDRNQPGDPAKLAKALMIAVNSDTPPLRLLAGKAAVSAVDQYLDARRSEYEAWREVSLSTDFV